MILCIPLKTDDINAFSVHNVDSIERLVFVVDCEEDEHQKILVAKEQDDWAEFLG